MDYNKLIDNYLSGNLSPEEKAAFREAMKKDATLLAEVQFQEELDAALTETDVIQLRTTLDEIHQQIHSGKEEGLVRRLFSRKIVQLAAAVITLLLLSTTVYLVLQQPSLSTDALYQMYYQPDEAVMFMRSGSADTDGLLLEALRKYEQQDYQGALQLFKKDESSILVHFYSGLAYMELELFDEAILSFRKILNDGNNLFVEQANWYQGLCYLKTQREGEARKSFENLKMEGNPYKPKADFILSNLKK